MMTTELDASHDAARVYIYTSVAERGAPPTSSALASHLGISRHDALNVLRTLGAERKVILDDGGEVRMCGPFSAVATRFRVHGAHASWWANCAWDMLGVPASLGVSARVETSCACCDEPATIAVDAESGPASIEGLVHILLPARRWYDDIGFT